MDSGNGKGGGGVFYLLSEVMSEGIQGCLWEQQQGYLFLNKNRKLCKYVCVWCEEEMESENKEKKGWAG